LVLAAFGPIQGSSDQFGEDTHGGFHLLYSPMTTDKHTALIVDDEPDIRELLDITLTRMGLEVKTAADLTTAGEQLSRRQFDLCFTDMKLPDGSGIDLVRQIADQYPGMPVAVITAHGNMAAAVDALKGGAFDFVSKPVDLKILRNLVTQAIKLGKGSAHEDIGGESRLLGQSQAMATVRRTIAKLACSQAPVFIGGESGSGKELAACLIHEQGPRADGPFVAVNCGAIPTELMESELFGHRKGSFTGASTDKAGLFQSADGGTLFLDEVADLPVHMQVKLLRVIQEKAVRPIGANRELSIDVRVLSASHKPLREEVDQGRFREDLYYRINVIEMRMPSLRERPEDIPELVDQFLSKIADEWDISTPKMTSDALSSLMSYGFPGNVRELENVLERAVTLCEGVQIGSQDLQLGHLGGQALDEQPAGESASLDELMDDVERKAIIKALEETRFNKTAAAKKLGITFRALRYRLKRLDLE
jgi:two-component system response regulator PilR (NtrC family)